MTDNLPPGGLSVVRDYGEHGGNCGYCGQAGCSFSHGMMADRLSVEAYQELVDRGWRRSGRWVYYPLQGQSCCQLLTIRLDVSRFQPNKDQRRVLRRWQSHLDGAPLRAEQHAQHAAAPEPPPVVDSQHGSPRAPAGGSPKRPHDDIADGLQWGLPPASGQQRGGVHAEGGGKRSRRAAAEDDGEDGSGNDGEERPPRGASPASRLSEHLQAALHTALLHAGEGPSAVEHAWGTAPVSRGHGQQQRQQQQQASPAEAGDGATQLAAGLTAALRQAVAAGLLPSAAYPDPRVQVPTAKQRKLLPVQITHTTAFPLAVAAAASKALAASTPGGDGGARASAEEVAALLLQHLPTHLASSGQVAKGHLNFALQQPQAAGTAGSSSGAAAAAGVAGAAQPPPATQATPASAAGAAAATAAAAAAVAAAPIPRGVSRHFELRTLRSSEPGLVDAEFQLYKKYQVVHHGDEPGEVTRSAFSRFLVDSPLPHVGPEQYPRGGCPRIGFGSFHQQYWLDGRLVAVGVVDVLPRCLSSKYLFWDPDMSPLALGKLTSLKEIEWVQEARRSCPSLRYYYLGFYIHNCHRMRYKGDFAPSDLLCPKNKCWVPLERVKDQLNQPGVVPISELPGALEGLGPEHLVDAASGRPACPPKQPSGRELSRFKLLLRLARGEARVVTYEQLVRAGAVPPGSELGSAVSEWWSRAGPAAAAITAYSV